MKSSKLSVTAGSMLTKLYKPPSERRADSLSVEEAVNRDALSRVTGVMLARPWQTEARQMTDAAAKLILSFGFWFCRSFLFSLLLKLSYFC